MLRQSIMALALAGAMHGGWVLPAAAQQNGLVIENNGVDNANSAAGADNVRISRNPGASQSNNSAGEGNEELRAVREPKEKKAKDKGNRNAGEAAPAEAAPAEGDYEAYSGDAGYVPESELAAPQEASDGSAPVKLPNTGAGAGAGSAPWAAIALAATAAAFGAATRRRPV